MKYFKVMFDCDFAGCTSERYFKVKDEDEESFRNQLLQMVLDEMSGYEYMATTDIDREDYDTEDDYAIAIDEAVEDFYNNCGYTVFEIAADFKDKYAEEQGIEEDEWEDF